MKVKIEHIPTWLYKPGEQPKVVTSMDEAKAAVEAGWTDTPAKFPKKPGPKGKGKAKE